MRPLPGTESCFQWHTSMCLHQLRWTCRFENFLPMASNMALRPYSDNWPHRFSHYFKMLLHNANLPMLVGPISTNTLVWGANALAQALLLLCSFLRLLWPYWKPWNCNCPLCSQNLFFWPLVYLGHWMMCPHPLRSCFQKNNGLPNTNTTVFIQ